MEIVVEENLSVNLIVKHALSEIKNSSVKRLTEYKVVKIDLNSRGMWSVTVHGVADDTSNIYTTSLHRV